MIYMVYSTMEKTLVQEGLELLLKKVDYEISRIEAKLNKIARKFGLKEWRELEEFMKSRGIDNPEADLVWTEYTYLHDRLETPRKRRQRILQQLSKV